MRYILFILMLSCMPLFAQPDDGEVDAPLQQQNVNTSENLNTKLGIKFTLGEHKFRGNAFDNSKFLYGFGAGMYNIINLNKNKNLKLQWELNINFKGSRFAKPNDTSYSKISLAYLEVPVMMNIKLMDTKSKQPLYLQLGGQFGYLFRSTINKAYGQYGEVKTNLPFFPVDLAPVIGLQKEIGSGMSMQFCAKFGTLNIYTNTFWERSQSTYAPASTNDDYRDLTPAFKDGTHSVRNISFEFSLLF